MYLMIGNDEYYIECTYEYIRGMKGLVRNGLQIDPDEPSNVEISKVLVDFSEDSEAIRLVEIDLPPQVIRDLELELLQEIEC